MEDTNLSWEVAISSGDDWITVSPTAGTGSMPITVHVESATSMNETNLEGTITITCTDCSPRQSKVITVRRCKPSDCVYETTGVTEYIDAGTIPVGKCAGSTSFTVSYTTTYQSTNGCQQKVENGSETIYYSWEDNTTTSEKTLEEVAGKYKIVQEAGPCETPPEPVTCGCNQITYDRTSLTWDYNDNNYQNVIITIAEDCRDSITLVTATMDGGFTLESLEGNTLGINPPNVTTGATGNVTIKYRKDGTESECTNVISLTKRAQGDPCAGVTINIRKNPETLTCTGGDMAFSIE